MFLKVTAFIAIATCVCGVMMLDADSATPVAMCLASMAYLLMVLCFRWDRIVRTYEFDEVDELLRGEAKR